MSLTNDIRKAVIALGVPCIRIQSGQLGRGNTVHLARAGTPDLWTPLGFLECKRPVKSDKANPAQLAFYELMSRWGVKVAIVRSMRDAIEIVHAWKSEREHAKAMGWDAR